MDDYLSLEDLLLLIDRLQIGPVRDLGLLDSAAHRPTVVLWGQDAYPTLALKASALLESLVGNHALVDGNKRLGFEAMLVFLLINAHRVEVNDDAAYDLIIGVASGQMSLQDIAATIETWL